MSIDRNWMHQRIASNGRGLTDEYREGMREFLNFALENGTDSRNKIRCPCTICRNLKWKDIDLVDYDLRRHGFLGSYKFWDLHGEVRESNQKRTSSSKAHFQIPNSQDVYDAIEMLQDATAEPLNFEASESTRRGQPPNEDAAKFYNLVHDAMTPIYPGNEKFSKVTFVTKFLHFKNLYGCSEKGFNELLELIGSVLPGGNTLPKSYYEVKKMIKGLNLEYQKIDACEDDCMLYYGENADKQHCDICEKSRYKEKTLTIEKKIPSKILRYFPLTPRLQRLFMSSHTAEHMRWYKNRETKPGELTHPADGEEWKKIDCRYRSFANEIRNVRLGLATDGFNPFSKAFAKQYSVWPVVMVIYNLPSSMCMKDPYMCMSLLIPGEKSPTRDINVYLRPLIDELKMLWDTGVQTFDRHMNENFTMKAALLWTINDFPVYGMVSGWSTHGRLACPVCLGDVQGFQLKHGGNCSFFGTSRLFLDESDPLRKCNKFGFIEKRSAKRRYCGEEIKSQCQKLVFPPHGKKTWQGKSKQIWEEA